MSAPVEVSARLAECRAVLGGERDKMRAIWDEELSLKERVLLLAMGRRAGPQADSLAERGWCFLPPEVRADVVGGLRRFRAWSERICA